MPRKSVLITGGSGFIGTHLCRALIERGHPVRVLDVRDPEAAIPGVDYQKGDVLVPSQVRRALEGVDLVFHLAATVSVPLCQQNPVQSYQTNFLGVCVLLDSIVKSKKRTRVVFASSSAVYGDCRRQTLPRRESEPIHTPSSFYAAQKLAAEHALALYRSAYGIPSIVFRFFNVFGPGQDPSSPYSGVVSVFARRILAGETVQLNGGGHQTRDFVFVEDIVSACCRTLSLPERCFDGKPVNLGSGRSVTIRSLAERMMTAAHRRVSLRIAAIRPGDVQHSLASIQTAREKLNWKPQVSLKHGVSRLLKSLREPEAGDE